MDTLKELNELYDKKFYSFFQSKFVGKNIEKAIDETFTQLVIKLLRVQIQFSLMLDCLETIKCNENVYKKLSQKEREKIVKNLKLLKLICGGLDNLAKHICKSLT